MYKVDSKELELRQGLRGRYVEGLRWYAVMVHTGREMQVAKFIGEEIYDEEIAEVLLPVAKYDLSFPSRQKAGQPKLLFCSYLFVQCAMSDGVYGPIAEHRAVHQILGRAYRIPSVLEDREIEDLKKILESDCRPELASRRNVGEYAEIIDGLMAGITGRIVKANAKEVKLEVPFSFLDMGTSVVVAVPRFNVKIREQGMGNRE